MSSIIEALGNRAVGIVESVSANVISVLVDLDAPQAMALNTGAPAGFPRINGYLLIPNESGAMVGVVTSVRVERLPYPKRKGMEDCGLVDLPFPARILALTPLGTLTVQPSVVGGEIAFRVSHGVDVFPSVGDPVLLPTTDQLRAIVEGEACDTDSRILLGVCPTAAGAPVHIDPDKIFGRHLAVLGNTGAGKSCTVAGLIRWSLEAAQKARTDAGRTGKPNARFIVLDPNGEYARAFKDLDARIFQVESATDAERLKVPAWLWNGDEWAAFTGAAPGVQRPILFDALRRLRSGAGEPDVFETRVRSRVRRYQDRLRVAIAGSEHLGRGRREGVSRILSNLQEDFCALAAQSQDAVQKGLLEDLGSKAGAAEIAARSNRDAAGVQWHNDFSEESLGKVQQGLNDIANAVGLRDIASIVSEDVPVFFSASELPGFVEALAADAGGRDVSQFVDSLNLRIRGLFAAGPLASVVNPADSPRLTLDQWLTNYVGANQASNGPIAVVDLSLVPSEAVHVVVAVLARMVFEAVQRHRRENGSELPTVLVLDEAHTFVHRELTAESASASGRMCCRTFERIAREGRKFGLGLVLASQRPSEVSPTVLSQCNTFLLHRIVNDRDQELVKSMVPDGLGGLLRDLPSLPSRRAILLGWGAHTPVLVEIRELPELVRPHSPDPTFWRVWTGEQPSAINWKIIATTWTGVPGTPPAAPSREL